jgi:hypothetical protein
VAKKLHASAVPLLFQIRLALHDACWSKAVAEMLVADCEVRTDATITPMLLL